MPLYYPMHTRPHTIGVKVVLILEHTEVVLFLRWSSMRFPLCICTPNEQRELKDPQCTVTLYILCRAGPVVEWLLTPAQEIVGLIPVIHLVSLTYNLGKFCIQYVVCFRASSEKPGNAPRKLL